MNFKNILFALIFFALFIETTILPLPFVFVFCVLLYILYPETLVLVIALVAGLILDALRLTTFGLTPLAIILSCALVEILKKVAEFKDYKVILVFLLISSYIFARVFSYESNILLYVLIYAVAGFVTFYLYRKKILW